MLETRRLILRPWNTEDAEPLYKYAADPDVGVNAGWPAHTSLENSRWVIENILAVPETYAVVLRSTGEPIGSVGIRLPCEKAAWLGEHEAELGWWLGKPHWGQGIATEAAEALMERCFEDLGCVCVWAAHFDGNDRSRRVMEKCGMVYDHTIENKECQVGVRTLHYRKLTRENWEAVQQDRAIWRKMLAKARSVQNPRVVSPFVEAGSVAAAVRAKYGRICAGVCIDTASGMGMCAERNAMAHLLTHGESALERVVAIMPDGRVGSPCGVCREFMMQLDRDAASVRILVNADTFETVTLGELMPDWWGRERFEQEAK